MLREMPPNTEDTESSSNPFGELELEVTPLLLGSDGPSLPAVVLADLQIESERVSAWPGINAEDEPDLEKSYNDSCFENTCFNESCRLDHKGCSARCDD